MQGTLATNGYIVAQSRVGASLRRVNPDAHSRRSNNTERLRNPLPYLARYFGEKMHIDQNEKLVMFGVTHICGIDGFSGKIVGFCSMPIKNCISIYEYFYRYVILHSLFSIILYTYSYNCRRILSQFGMWDQLRVDCGTEWALILFIQEYLSAYRNNTTKQSYLQTSSTNVSNVFIICLIYSFFRTT